MGLRILCVTPWFPNSPTDGRYNFIFHSVLALAAAGHEVSVLVTRPWIPGLLAARSASWTHSRVDVQSEPFGASLRIETMRYPSLPRYVLAPLVDAFYRRRVGSRIRRLIEARRIDLVHAHTEQAASAAIPAATPSRVPVVVSLHGISTAPQLLNSPGKRRRLRHTLTQARRVVLVGEPLRAHYAPLAGRDENFRVIPNGFFLPETNGESERPLRTGILRFVSVSNLDEGKGIDLNLRALARVRNAGCDDWSYDVIGEGAERAELEGLAVELGLREKVRFHGWLAHDRAVRHLADADVFILPSYREAFGVAYLEAMASGLLAIGVEGQGPNAFIQHGVTGLLVKPRDVDSLFDAIKRSLEQRAETQRMAAAGRRFVRSEFTWARHAERLIELYGEALAS